MSKNLKIKACFDCCYEKENRCYNPDNDERKTGKYIDAHVEYTIPKWCKLEDSK